MNINELIEILEDHRDSYGDDVEVKIAFQPSWPLVGDVINAWNPIDDWSEGDVDEDGAEVEEPTPVVWLAVDASTHDGSPYAPRRAFGGE